MTNTPNDIDPLALALRALADQIADTDSIDLDAMRPHLDAIDYDDDSRAIAPALQRLLDALTNL